MIIANDLRKKNIAEYILYMWQIEDLIRAYDFKIDLIKENLISRYQNTKEVITEIEHWYEGLIDLMEIDNIKHRGHFKFIYDILEELNQLHVKLLSDGIDKKYKDFYQLAGPNIQKLKEKSNTVTQRIKNITDIEICLNGMYGLLIMRLKKQEVSKETTGALKTISNLLNYLSLKFKESEENKNTLL